MSSRSEPISSLPYYKKFFPHYMSVLLSFSRLCFFIPLYNPSFHYACLSFPSLSLFISCCCFCTVSLFLKVQIEIAELIPEKRLCFPCHRVAQLAVWLCATITYAARFYVAKEHRVQCHFLSKPNSITMHTGLRSHQPHKISL